MSSKKETPDTWMPFYMGDFEVSTSSLTHEEKWGYLKVIFEYWRLSHKGIKIKFDKKIVKNISKISMKKAEKILTFFENKDGFLYHKRIEREVTKAIETKAKNAARTEAATQARLAKERLRNEGVNRERNEALDEALDEDPTTTTLTPLKDKSLRESKALFKIFKSLAFEEEFVTVATEAGLTQEQGAFTFQIWKIKRQHAPPQDFVGDFSIWCLREWKPTRTGAASSKEEKSEDKPLKGKDLLMHKLGIWNFERRLYGKINTTGRQILEEWEAKNGKVTWDNWGQYVKQQEGSNDPTADTEPLSGG